MSGVKKLERFEGTTTGSKHCVDAEQAGGKLLTKIRSGCFYQRRS
jgi:hypothetical protein